MTGIEVKSCEARELERSARLTIVVEKAAVLGKDAELIGVCPSTVYKIDKIDKREGVNFRRGSSLCLSISGSLSGSTREIRTCPGGDGQGHKIT